MGNIGKRMKQARAMLDLSQAEFASGISMQQTAIGMYERGDRKISKRTIQQLRQVYGINPEWLETGIGEMFIPTESKASVLEQLASEYQLDEAQTALASAYLDLNQEQRKALIAFIEAAANRIRNAKSDDSLALDDPSVEAMAHKMLEDFFKAKKEESQSATGNASCQADSQAE